MPVVDELGTIWIEMSDALAEAGLAVFPTIPNVSATAIWPDGDWRQFLNVAIKSAVTIVYLQQLQVDDEEIGHFRAEMFERSPMRRRPIGALPRPQIEDRKQSDEELAVLSMLESHEGELFEVSLGFVNGGVLHLWTVEPRWWSEIVSTAATIREQELDDDVERADAEEREVAATAKKAQEHNWAMRAAEDRRFIAAVSRQARVEVLYQIVPELKQLVDRFPGWAPRRVASDLAIEAEGLAEQHVKPRLTRQAMQDLEQLAKEVATEPEWQMARSKPVRSDIVKRFLRAKYGFVMPAVVDQLASRNRDLSRD